MGRLHMDPRGATIALVGFVCGLLLMYITLLGRIQPLHHVAPSDGFIHDLTGEKGIPDTFHNSKVMFPGLSSKSDRKVPRQESQVMPDLRTTGSPSKFDDKFWSEFEDVSAKRPGMSVINGGSPGSSSRKSTLFQRHDLWNNNKKLADNTLFQDNITVQNYVHGGINEHLLYNRPTIHFKREKSEDIFKPLREKRLPSDSETGLIRDAQKPSHSETGLIRKAQLPSHSETGLSWDSIQEQRIQTVADKCQSFHLHRQLSTTWQLLQNNNNIYVDNKHGLVYCSIPKAACSSWKTALALLTDQVPAGTDAIDVHNTDYLSSLGIGQMGDLNITDLKQVLRRYTKMMVVRHPLERLVSAYRDKFCTYNKWTRHFQMKYGRRIVWLYRGVNATAKSVQNGHDVTFLEFLRFLVDKDIRLEARMNPHWGSYQVACHPCHVRYDHIIKFETLDQDNAVILKRFFSVADATKFFPRRNVKDVPSRDIMTRHYSDIPRDIMVKVYTMVKDDMDLYGYDLPPGLLSR